MGKYNSRKKKLIALTIIVALQAQSVLPCCAAAVTPNNSASVNNRKQALPTRAAFMQVMKALIFTLRITPTLKAALSPAITPIRTNFQPAR